MKKFNPTILSLSPINLDRVCSVLSHDCYFSEGNVGSKRCALLYHERREKGSYQARCPENGYEGPARHDCPLKTYDVTVTSSGIRYEKKEVAG